MVKAFDLTDMEHWRRRWSAVRASTSWIGNGLIYHEDVALLEPRLKILDPTDGAWVDESALTGYGRIVAIRFVPGLDRPEGPWTDYSDGSWHVTAGSTGQPSERAS